MFTSAQRRLLLEGKAIGLTASMKKYAQVTAEYFVSSILEFDSLEDINLNPIKKTGLVDGLTITTTFIEDNTKNTRAEAVLTSESMKDSTRQIHLYLRKKDKNFYYYASNLDQNEEYENLLEQLIIEAISHELIHCFDPSLKKFLGMSSQPKWFQQAYDGPELDRPSEVDAYINQLSNRIFNLLPKDKNLKQAVRVAMSDPFAYDLGEYNSVMVHFKTNPKTWKKYQRTLYDIYQKFLGM